MAAFALGPSVSNLIILSNGCNINDASVLCGSSHCGHISLVASEDKRIGGFRRQHVNPLYNHKPLSRSSADVDVTIVYTAASPLFAVFSSTKLSKVT